MPELKQNVKPRGKAKRETDEARAARTTPGALRGIMDEAGADWRENAPRGFKTILDVEK